MNTKSDNLITLKIVEELVARSTKKGGVPLPPFFKVERATIRGVQVVVILPFNSQTMNLKEVWRTAP